MGRYNTALKNIPVHPLSHDQPAVSSAAVAPMPLITKGRPDFRSIPGHTLSYDLLRLHQETAPRPLINDDLTSCPIFNLQLSWVVEEDGYHTQNKCSKEIQ